MNKKVNKHKILTKDESFEILQQNIETIEGYLGDINRVLEEDLTTFLPFVTEKFEQITWAQTKDCNQLVLSFIRMQDALAAKIFPLFLEVTNQPTDGLIFLDKLIILEKIGIVKDAGQWEALRNLRNHFSHEYTNKPDLQAKYMNALLVAVPVLVACFDRIKERLKIENMNKHS